MITALALMSLHKGPTIPLADICERYFGYGYEEALRRHARGELPVPAFRLHDSRKAPLMVTCEDLGAHIDRARDKAAKLLEACQV